MTAPSVLWKSDHVLNDSERLGSAGQVGNECKHARRCKQRLALAHEQFDVFSFQETCKRVMCKLWC
jgi:hypothetical protein